jgi:predicted nuclease of predicted toxin-antitoxin system
MNFLADQNFPRTCEPLLKKSGHTLSDVVYDPKAGLSDTWLFGEAQRLKAVLPTTDKDFFHTVPWLFAEHAGAIVINLRKPNRVEILAKLEWALEFLNSHSIENHVLLLRDNRAYYSKRIYPKP